MNNLKNTLHNAVHSIQDTLRSSTSASWSFSPIRPAPIPEATLRRSSTDYRAQIHGSTDYLDSLRGLASLIVLITHTLGNLHPELYWGYGTGPSGHRYLFQLPVIRLVYGGSAMVAIFFIVSGYVLAFKPLQRARGAQWDGLFVQLSSSVLRRAGRLLVPSMIVSLVTMVLAQFGAFEHSGRLEVVASIHWPVGAQSAESVWEQVGNWGRETWIQFDPWTWKSTGPDYAYGLQFWTIAIELRCSMILYLFITATSLLRYRARRVLAVVFQAFSLLTGRWDIALFIFGMFLADGHVEREAVFGGYGPLRGMYSQLPGSGSLGSKFFTAGLFVTGLYLASNPDQQATNTPGYRFLNRALVPTRAYPDEEVFRFWIALGAALVVYAISRSALLQEWLRTSTVVQYLGRISFALYLVHAAVVSSVGAWVFGAMLGLLSESDDGVDGEEHVWQYELSFGVMFLVSCAVAIVVADLFWRVVDVPVVRLTKRVEAMALARTMQGRGDGQEVVELVV